MTWQQPIIFDGNVRDLRVHGIQHEDVLAWVREQGLDPHKLSPRVVIMRNAIGDGYVIRVYTHTEVVLDGPPPWLPADLPSGSALMDLGRTSTQTQAT